MGECFASVRFPFLPQISKAPPFFERLAKRQMARLNPISMPASNSSYQACVLAVVAGFSDTVGFLTFGAFAGLMSGNTVLLGIALAAGRMADAMHSAVIIAAFLSGIGLSSMLSRKALPMAWLVALEAILLLVAALLPIPFAAPMLALAMGIQNAMATHFDGLTLNTVFLTGDLQQLILALTARANRKPDPPQPDGSNVIILLWLCYLAGAALGAASHACFARPLLPVLLLLPLVFLKSTRQGRRNS